MVQDQTVILDQTTVAIRIWVDLAHRGKDFPAVQELDIIVRAKIAIKPAVEAVLVLLVGVQKTTAIKVYYAMAEPELPIIY
jgi:hypothetical protein